MTDLGNRSIAIFIVVVLSLEDLLLQSSTKDWTTTAGLAFLTILPPGFKGDKTESFGVSANVFVSSRSKGMH